jgi:dTDP-4-dehydrorhamnose reductase
VLIHLAAFTDVNRAWQERGKKDSPCYRINVLGTRNVVKMCRRYGQYLIHVSTDFVFNGEKKSEYTEEDEVGPVEWYGQTKAWAEEEVRNGLASYAIVRIAFPFRASFIGKSDVVRKIKDGLVNKTLPLMFTDQIITPTLIDEIAVVVDKMIQQKPQGIYHVTGANSISPYKLALEVARVFKLDQSLVRPALLVEFIKNNPQVRPYQKRLALSNHKVRGELGVKLSSFDEGLREIKSQMKS